MSSFIQIVDGMKVLIDVGCSYGAVSIAFTSVNKNGVSYAFDGSTKAIDALKQTLSLNPHLNIKPELCLVGNINGNVHCMFDEHQSLVGGNAIQVKMIRIDDFCKKNNIAVDVLKVDVEDMSTTSC
jgi:FkbM family methyltransferase